MPRFEPILDSMIQNGVTAYHLLYDQQPRVETKDGHIVSLQTKAVDETTLSTFLSYAFQSQPAVTLTNYQTRQFTYANHVFDVEVHRGGITLKLSVRS